MNYVIQVLISGLSMGLIYALPALSVVLLFNTAGFFNMAQGEFLALSTFVLYQFHVLMNMNLVIAIPITLLLMAGLGILINIIFFNPLRRFKSKDMITLIVTIALGSFIQYFIQAVWGTKPLQVDIFSTGIVKILGASVKVSSFWILGISLVLVVLLYILSQKSSFGMAMRAASEDREGAQLMGIKVNAVIGAAFAISLGITAIAGILSTSVLFLEAHMGTSIGTKAFASAVIGGFGNPVGAIAGGLIIGIVESLVSMVLPASYKNAITFLLLIIFLLFKPSGIFKTKTSSKL